MKVKMIPGVGQEGDRTTGISQVVFKYIEYLKKMDVEFVDHDQDVIVGHAGVTGKECDVSVLHGVYWTADHPASKAEHVVNAKIVDSMRSAKVITVPSNWVKKTIERDFRVSPVVINHGIEWEEWQEPCETEDYILWNKNRLDRICDPHDMQRLAGMFKNKKFLTTFAFDNAPSNIKIIGKQPFDEMKSIVKRSNIYLSLVKETFGIGVLEALASGVPVLGWDYGGNQDTIIHGVNGYLAQPNNFDDLANGLDYCLQHRKVLGDNARETAQRWKWQDAVTKLYEVIEVASKPVEQKVSVIIPTYNYADKLPRAITSMCNQTLKPHEIIVVDDGSSDDPEIPVKEMIKAFPNVPISIYKQKNSGVAIARNTGVKKSTGNYICCLDPDDAVEKQFLEVCVDALENNRDKYIAYTTLKWIKPDGSTGVSPWPSDYNYDKQLKRQNQVPSCNVARKEAWLRVGGQRQRYAPIGAGSEDAEMWLRAGAHGMGGILATKTPLFIYSWMSGIVSGNKEYREVDWLGLHPYTEDEIHPFSSCATPKNRIAHLVTQYDEATISIIIPVSERHIDTVINALDSVESQSYRYWEVIVIDDSTSKIDNFIKDAYPFVTWLETGKKKGAGAARNLGVEHSSTSLLLFLDADDVFSDWKSLEKVLDQHIATGDIVYTDYTIKTKEKDEITAKETHKSRFISYNNKSKIALASAKSLDYECKKAQEDPDYNWCIISCLVPKYIHKEVNGFNTDLEILEDIDYYKRIAKRGYCFTRIKEELFIIDRTSIVADEKHKKNIDNTFTRIKKLLERTKNMACKGCGGKSKITEELKKVYNDSYKRVITKSSNESYNDDDFVRCIYSTPKAGDHSLIGTVTGINYGYRARGDKVLIHKKDFADSAGLFEPIGHTVQKVEKEVVDTPPPPEPIDDDGLSTRMSESLSEERLTEFGISRSVDVVYYALLDLEIDVVGKIPTLTIEQLTEIKGIGEATARKLKDNAVKYING